MRRYCLVNSCPLEIGHLLLPMFEGKILYTEVFGMLWGPSPSPRARLSGFAVCGDEG